jgi:hypothetical protein
MQGVSEAIPFQVKAAVIVVAPETDNGRTNARMLGLVLPTVGSSRTTVLPVYVTVASPWFTHIQPVCGGALSRR